MTTTDYPRGARWRSLRATRLALAGLVAAAAFVVPGIASAATHTAHVTGITTSPSLAGNGGFGLYNFSITSDKPGDSFPFASGPKFGHCVEATEGSGNNATALRTEADLMLGNSDAGNLAGDGFTAGAKRVEWILLSSYKFSKADASGVQGAAHQSAIWHITNPSSPGVITISGNSADQIAARAKSASLITDSATYGPNVSNTADLAVDGGADLQTCAGTSRTVTVTGSPWTDATLTLSGAGVFHTGGGATTTVNLGASGAAQVQIDSTGPGSIGVTASVKIATMVQADNGGHQDFVYLEFQTVSKNVTLTFTNCQDLTVSKTASPSYTRSYTWKIEKKVNGKDNDGPISSDQPTVPTHYTVTTTKSGANHDYKLAGTITVTNPNSYAVSGASVTDQAPTGFACATVPANGALGSIAAGASVTVPYTCTYSGTTAPTTGSNSAKLTWTTNNATGHTAAASAAYNFATAAVSVEHNAVDVLDTNVAAKLATNVTAAGSYQYDVNVPVPNLGCTVTPNTAMVTDTGSSTSVLDKDTASIQLCRTQQGLALAKTADPGFTRSFDWTVSKAVDQSSVTTAADTATFNYSVVATKGAATDSGWQVTGSISVTNPNVYTVTDVMVSEQGVDNGGVCVLKSSGALGSVVQGQTVSVDYVCTYAAAPSPAAGTNTANVTWTLPASGDTAATTDSGTVTQGFAFGAPTTLVHDAVNVGDLFDGAAPVTLVDGAGITASKAFSYSRTVAVPATGCRIYNNTANVTASDVPSYSKDASATVTVCRAVAPTPPATPVPPVTPPVGPAAVPSRTKISLTKRASSSTVKAGGTVGFTIVWKNTGQATAKNVSICDDLPNQLTFVTAKGAAFKNGKACWTRKSVAKGTTLTFRVVARVDAGVGNEKLVNVATATASNAKPATAKAPVRALRNARTRAGGVTG